MTYTLQSAFDKVAVALLKQKEKSVSKDGRCRYRGLNNTKCALGYLIEDEDYRSAMEGCGPGCGIFDSWKVKTNLLDVNFLHNLQKIHDMEEPSEWKKELIKFAEKYNLNTNVIDNME